MPRAILTVFAGRRSLAEGILVCALCAALPRAGLALDVGGAEMAGLDNPQINFVLRRGADGAPIEIPFLGDINIDAILDTGASGIVLNESRADLHEIERIRYPGPTDPLVEFYDIGIAGSATFHVSEELHLGLAPFPSADVNNPFTADLVYDQAVGPVRLQIGPVGDALSSTFDINIVGTAAMRDKVVVMDARPVDDIDFMRTYVYDPGIAFDPTALDSDPGIPVTGLHIDMTRVDVSGYTSVVPQGAPAPTLRGNPFIGGDPTGTPDPDAPPGIRITHGGLEASGSFLLDTGNQGSVISTELAAALNIRYRPGSREAGNPLLEYFDPADPAAEGVPVENQFQLGAFGVGGQAAVAGFYLDGLQAFTREGDPENPDDPNHLRWSGAAVTVLDVTLPGQGGEPDVVLPGIFGMNLLVASVGLDASGLPDLSTLQPGFFDFIVFDEGASVLGFDLPPVLVPLPSPLYLMIPALLSMGLIVRRRPVRAI